MKKIAFVLIVCLTAAAFAYAEEKKEESVLGKAMDEVFGSFREIFYPYYHVDTVVVTPSRYEEPSLNVSKNVTVIDEEAIRRSNARYVPELLESLTGVVVRDFLGNGKAVQADIRGFGDTAPSNVLVLIDGRRTNQIDISGTDWAQIDVGSIERIELVRGPQTVLYGDNASAGVINIITKTGANKKPEIGFNYKTGSYAYNSYGGYIDGGTDFLDYYSSLSYSNTNGYRTNNGLETTDFNSNITIKPYDDVRIKLEAGYHKDWYGQPGALKPQDIDSVGWRGSINPNDRAKTEDFYLLADPRFKKDLGFGEILLSGDIIFRGRRTASVNYYSDGSNTEFNNHIKTFGVTPKAAFSADFLNIHNRMIAGLDYYGSRDEILGTNFGGGKDLINIDKDTLGIYITDTVNLLSSLILNCGYRAEWAYYKFNQEAMISGVNRKKPFEYAAEAGITYKYNEKSAVYANYSRSFRFPAVDEWYSSFYKDYWTGDVQGGLNLNLRPQEGNNYEIGIKENSSKYLSVKADYFIMDTKHELYFDPLTFSNAIYDHTMRHGLELETHAYLFDRHLDCFANYTYENAFFSGGTFASNSVPMVPCHKFSGGFDYKFMDCVDLNYVANFVGLRRFINDQKNNAPRLKSYIIHNIKLSYYKYGLELYTALYNIFDEKYSEYGVTNASGTSQAYYPSPGQNFIFGANYKF